MTRHPGTPTFFPADPRTRLVALVALAAGACGGSAAPGGGGAGVASEAEWRELREPRPAPLPTAPRLTVSRVDFLGSYPWPPAVRVEPHLGLSELVVTNLLRRRDVHFVERRRFAAAVAAIRRGDPASPGRPPPGVSQGADLALVATWLPTTADEASVEVRLTRLETGDVEAATRVVLPREAGPVLVARAIVAGALEALRELGPLPEWTDPLDGSGAVVGLGPGGSVNVGTAARVSTEALRHFLRGLAAEETWSWERARRGYQQAIATDPDFHEARVALARTARLRLGGTLAES